ncbi:MAG: ATP-binding protein, partial [Simkaniaceae bacterium]|nr:ATP-binding protein [Simkaniaceae bacterium]
HILWFNEHINPKLNKSFYNKNGHLVKVHISAPTGLNLPKKPQSPSKQNIKPIHETYTSDPLESYATFPLFISETNQNIPFKLLSDLVGYKQEKSTFGKNEIQLGEYNPIYLYGPKGSGKTHLLMATAKACMEKGIPTVYIKAETFSEHVIRAFRTTTLKNFRETYRQNHVLIIDDIHILSRKTATQEELFHTFNNLQTAGMQMIFSANCAPRDLREIEERLISRFEWGLTLPFKDHTLSEKKAIAKLRCKLLKFPLSTELIDYLLNTFSHISELLTSIEALVLRSHHTKHPQKSHQITVEFAKNQLKDLIAIESKNQLNSDKILKIIATFFGIRIEDIVGKAQSKDCVAPRQIAMYFCRTKLKLPYLKIGDLFMRDHSTVMSSVKRIIKGIETNDRTITAPLLDIQKLFDHL